MRTRITPNTNNFHAVYFNYNGYRQTFRGFPIVKVFTATQSFFDKKKMLFFKKPTAKPPKICLKDDGNKYFVVIKYFASHLKVCAPQVNINLLNPQCKLSSIWWNNMFKFVENFLTMICMICIFLISIRFRMQNCLFLRS